MHTYSISTTTYNGTPVLFPTFLVHDKGEIYLSPLENYLQEACTLFAREVYLLSFRPDKLTDEEQKKCIKSLKNLIRLHSLLRQKRGGGLR